MSDSPTVFLVEDDAAVRDSLVSMFELAGFNVESFESGPHFLSHHDPERRGCLVLDVNLPGMTGTELHEQLAAAGTVIPTVFLTGHAPPEVSEKARKQGVVAVFEKPCVPAELIRAVAQALSESDVAS
jgi:FixJ family two-component response regulator